MFRATRLVYNVKQEVIGLIGEEWQDVGTNGWPSNPCTDVNVAYQRTSAWEYRYDNGSSRYMRRQLDPDTMAEVLTEWSDYDEAGNITGDFEIIDVCNDAPPPPPRGGGGTGNNQTYDPTETSGCGNISQIARAKRIYFGGLGHVDITLNPVWNGSTWTWNTTWGAPVYYHGNQIGSVEMITDANGAEVTTVAYTAFGEEISLNPPADTRYGYAGQWGYEGHDDTKFMHVGARWYDPETGRFLQRDPIGIAGGLNVYAYVFNMPTVGVDPLGRGFWSAVGGAIGGAIGGAMSGAVSGFIVGGPAGAIAGAGAGVIAGGISGAVSGGLGGGGFGGGFVSGGINGAVAGFGGGILGGLAGASTGTVVAGGVIGGAISGGVGTAINGGSRGQIIGGAVTGGVFGGFGGAAEEAGQFLTSCMFAADAETIGGAIGRYK